MPFQVATKAVSIMRYLVENCTALPLSCLTRMLNTNDLSVKVRLPYTVGRGERGEATEQCPSSVRERLRLRERVCVCVCERER